MQVIETNDLYFSTRNATGEDAVCVVAHIHKLGAYQKIFDKITVTESQIKRLLDEN